MMCVFVWTKSCVCVCNGWMVCVNSLCSCWMVHVCSEVCGWYVW